MSLEENKALIRKLIEELNTNDLTVIDALLNHFLSPDFFDHSSQIHGRDNVKQGYTVALKDFPDLHRTIEDIIAEGDKVWFLEKDTWTDYSGKRVETTSLTILRVVNGKAVEGWGGYLHKTP